MAEVNELIDTNPPAPSQAEAEPKPQTAPMLPVNPHYVRDRIAAADARKEAQRPGSSKPAHKG